MFDPTDYPKQSWQGAGAEIRAEYERYRDEEEQRMLAFDAGLCSLGAAIEGGVRYERELAESIIELREYGGDPRVITEIFGGNEHIAAPVIEALNSSKRTAQRATASKKVA